MQAILNISLRQMFYKLIKLFELFRYKIKIANQFFYGGCDKKNKSCASIKNS